MEAALPLALFLCTIIISGWLYILWLEGRSIYFPEAAITQTPSALGLYHEDRTFTASDGIQLNAWYLPHQNSRLTVLFFHGNRGNISHRLTLYKHWHEMGLAVFAMDYRGFGKSRGHPSEAGLYADALAAWRELTEELSVPAERIIISGRSLGCAPATWLATQTEAAALVLETPFTSLADMAKKLYPWLPARLLVRTKFNNMNRVTRIQMPLLIITAENDAVTPQWMGRHLFRSADEPKQYRALSGGHNDFDQQSEAEYIRTWKYFLEKRDAYH